eukprot:CAMPEP_0177676658 /NCGR_PEP_ID=MMETSP0447-20121125/27926_1 /TAXON_ID=0 /ORGANISM="Stygamoeba regulata, Strain BSH-02190019" /LENGTH=114 /DNA_ID=CAMNT_0019185275 /DNA_START=151 /DNA_END=495 /DNA_ORIENTATION=+
MGKRKGVDQAAQAFNSRKAAILQSLAECKDKSPKGYVDEPIEGLLARINAHPDYVTTSSCCTWTAAPPRLRRPWSPLPSPVVSVSLASPQASATWRPSAPHPTALKPPLRSTVS